MALYCVAIPGGVLSYYADGDGGEGGLVVHRFRERDGVWRFQGTPGPSLSVEGCRRHVIACQTALDASQGVKIPFLVTRRRDSLSEVEILALSGPNTSPEVKMCGRLDMEGYSPTQQHNLHILNGPTLVWSQHSTLFVAHSTPHSPSLTTQEILMNTFMIHTSHEIDQMWCFNSLENSTLIFVRVTCSTEQRERSHWLCLSLTENGGGQELSVDRLPSRCYVPSDYGCIATCMTLHYRWSVEKNGDIRRHLEMVVGSKYKQVVLLRGGIPIHCISMETTPKELAVLQTPGNGAVVVAVRTEDKGLTVYRVSSEGDPQETKRWAVVDHALVGDFAHLPTDQLLITFSGNREEIVDYTVTDLTGFRASSQAEMESEVVSESLSDSLVSATRALQLQQRTREAYLTQLQRELQLKTELLESSLQLLTSLSSGPTPTVSPPRDKSLVCVLPGKMEGGETSRGVADSTHFRPVVTSCWQRLLNGCWLVGVVLKNTTDRIWRRMSLSLVMDEAPVVGEGECRLVWVGSKKGGSKRGEGSCKQPPTKRVKVEEGEKKLEEVLRHVGVEREVSHLRRYRLAPSEEACLVTWVTLPTALECEQISSGVLSGNLVFQWLEREGRGGSVRGGRCDGVNVVEVGRMHLPLHSLTDPALQCSEECLHRWDGQETMTHQWRDFTLRDTQDLASLLATRQATQLHVSSAHTDLLTLGDILRERLPLPPHCILPQCPCSDIEHRMETGSGVSGMGTGIVGRESQELSGVCLHVSTGNKRSATVSVLCRSPPSLSVVVSALRSCVPDDVTISHPHTPHTSQSSVVREDQTQHLRQCVTALRRELEKTKEVVERREEGKLELDNSELIDAMENSDYAMFTAMFSLDTLFSYGCVTHDLRYIYDDAVIRPHTVLALTS